MCTPEKQKSPQEHELPLVYPGKETRFAAHTDTTQTHNSLPRNCKDVPDATMTLKSFRFRRIFLSKPSRMSVWRLRSCASSSCVVEVKLRMSTSLKTTQPYHTDRYCIAPEAHCE